MNENYLEIYDAHDGCSQRSSLNKSLLPDSFQIDGRTTTELVAFAVKFSEALIYHDLKSKFTQSWKNFFIKDRYLFVYIIAHTNLKHTQRTFYRVYESILQNTDDEDKLAQLPQLVNPVRSILLILANWKSNVDMDFLSSQGPTDFSIYFPKAGLQDIKKVRNISTWIDPQAEAEKQWKTIEAAFAISDSSKSEKQADMLLAEALNQIRRTFEMSYRLAESNIQKSRDFITLNSKQNQTAKPHIALFFGFLKVYKVLQNRINGITERHLEYYFKDVLKISRLGKQPDDTFVQFELKKNVDACLLEEGTGVVVGKDASETPVVFKTINEVNLSKTSIRALYTLFVSQNSLNYSGSKSRKEITDIFYKKHDINYLGAWDVFGEDQFFKSAAEKTMTNAKVGFIIASELLLLKEGERKIQIDLMATAESYQLFADAVEQVGIEEKESLENTFVQLFNTAFDIFITLDGIETVFDHFSVINNPEINGFTIELLLSSNDPAITKLKTEQVAGQPTLSTAYIKVLLRDESHIFMFPFIQLLDIINININVEVEGLKDVILFNNYGQIDHSKPFQVFGTAPKPGSYFLIGSGEVFGKPNPKVDVNIEWHQLPSYPDGWATYFADYKEQVENTDFEVSIDFLKSGSWERVEPKSNFQLFEERQDQQLTRKRLSDETHFTNLELTPDLSELTKLKPFKPYTSQSRSGYLKMELTNPDFGFGFDSYQKNLYKSIRKNAKLNDDAALVEPNLPLSPMAKSISLNYKSKIEAVDDKGPSNAIQLYCLGPFGYKERVLISQDKTNKLLFDYKPEGHFMIGLDSYPKDGLLNLFMKMQLGNVESFIRKVPNVNWYYLKNNDWVKLPANAIRYDGTQGLFQSGVLSLKIPESIDTNNTLLSNKYYWLRASVDENSHIFPDVLSIHTNVARLRWDGTSSGEHLAQSLPLGSISKLQKLNPLIAKVNQVSESFNGKAEERKTNYYKRVSERLRHKNRAITNWDYERLVLQKFPYIFKVKCFNALKYADDNNSASEFIEPGNVLLLVIPDISNPFVRNKLRPKLGISILLRVRNYLQGLTSPFVKIEVKNPYYERIRVICKVKFTGNRNTGYYISKLNNDIVDYLTPWRSDSEIEDQFGNRIYRSKIMSFVHKREYVDFVTSFSIVKTNAMHGYFQLFDTARQDMDKEEIKPEFPWSILTSVEQHEISAIDDNKYRAQIPRGIGNMQLGADFVITNKK